MERKTRLMAAIIFLSLLPRTAFADESNSLTLPSCKGGIEEVKLGKYVEVGNVNKNEWTRSLFEEIRQSGGCADQQIPCIFMGDFVFILYFQGSDKYYFIDFGDPWCPINKGVEYNYQLWQRVEKAVEQLLQLLECQNVKIHYALWRVFKKFSLPYIVLQVFQYNISYEQVLKFMEDNEWFVVGVTSKK